MQLMQLQRIERLATLAHNSLVTAVSSLSLHREAATDLTRDEIALIDAQIVQNILIARDALNQAWAIVPDNLK